MDLHNDFFGGTLSTLSTLPTLPSHPRRHTMIKSPDFSASNTAPS